MIQKCFDISSPIIFIFVVVSFSCNAPVEYKNPFDPNVPLSTPSNLKINAFSENILSMQWEGNTKILNAQQSTDAFIIIEQSLDGINYSVLDSVLSSSSFASIEASFLINQEYYFRAYLRIGLRKTDASKPIKGIVTFSSPFNFRVLNLTENKRQFEWEWKQVSTAATGFQIVRLSLNSHDSVTIGQVPASEFTFVDTTVIKTEILYRYQIYALSGIGKLSTYDSLTLSISFPAPTDINLDGIDSNWLTIRWENHSPSSAQSIIEKSIIGSDFTVAAIIPPGISNFIDSSVNKYTTYQYRVISKTSYNISSASAVIRCSYQVNDISTARVIRTPTAPKTGRVGILSEDEKIFLSIGDSEGTVVDYTTGNIIKLINFPKVPAVPAWFGYYGVAQASFSRNKETFALTIGPNIYVYNTSSDSIIRKIDDSVDNEYLVLSNDGSKIFYNSGDDWNGFNKIKCRNINDGSLVWKTIISDEPSSLWVHPNDEQLLIGYRSSCSWVNIETGQLQSTVQGGRFIDSPVYIKGKAFVMSSNGVNYNVTNNETKYATNIHMLFSWTSIDNLFVVFVGVNEVSILNVLTRRIQNIARREGFNFFYSNVKFVANDKQVIVYNRDGELSVSDLHYGWSTY